MELPGEGTKEDLENPEEAGACTQPMDSVPLILSSSGHPMGPVPWA